MDRRVAVVIEDDEDIRGLMVALMGQSGFTVHEAATGTAGVEAVRAHDPVVVTVDLGLPDIDGYEVTRQVRQFSDAYLVMLTARTEEIDTLMGLEAGADDYVTKPFRPRELRARIDAMLRRPRTGPSPSSVPSPAPSPVPSPAPAPAAQSSPQHASQAAPTDGTASAVPGSVGPGNVGSGSVGPHGSDPGSSSTLGPEADHHLESDGIALYPRLHQVLAEGREVPMTPTEFVLLETLLRSGRVVRSKSELARIIRGDEADDGTFVSAADERTVEVHVGNLRRKLAEDPRSPRWVQTVRGVGYRMAGPVRALR